MKKFLFFLFILLPITGVVLVQPLYAQTPGTPSNLCAQFTDQSQQTRCTEVLAVCGGAPASECQKTAAIVSISLSIQEACRGRGVSASECLIQYDAAVAEAEECLSSLAGNSVAQCQNEAQIAAQQAAVLAAEAATPPRPPAQTTPTPNPGTPAGNTTPTTPTGNNGNLGYTPLEPIPGLAEAQRGNTNFALFLKYVFGVLISLGGLSAVVMLIFGGITYMVSDVVHKKTDALRRVQAAMWGLLLLIASWLILNAINPRLLVFELLINPVSNLSGNQTGSVLNTVTSGTVGNITLSDSDPDRGTKLNNWCPRGRPDPVSAQFDEFGTRLSTYTCAASNN